MYKTTNDREPSINVGILLEQTQISFEFHQDYLLNNKDLIAAGTYTAKASDGKIEFEGNNFDIIEFNANHTAEFSINDVIIGVNFHWERKETQRFVGNLKLIVENEKLTAINVLPLESYLTSVISSEMSATSSVELLKAHAVISRSWLIAQINKNEQIDTTQYQTTFESEAETIKWYDREDHANFDVCADDHCQRYQGITRQSTSTVSKVIEQTRGEVITYEDKICDARFSKCCGGIMETFENVWEPISHPYLQGKRDLIDPSSETPDLTNEEKAEKWIRSAPPAYCNTNNKQVLQQVLNDYDQETADFYRWRVEYSQSELANLIKKRTGIDYGNIIEMIPLERGTSGRLIKLKIVGTKHQRVIGKELEIRRSLSMSHLYSSAFVIDQIDKNEEGIPAKFILTGAGWGHGVGLCQIGAAEMSEMGFEYKEILTHYFPSTQISIIY